MNMNVDVENQNQFSLEIKEQKHFKFLTETILL